MYTNKTVSAAIRLIWTGFFPEGQEIVTTLGFVPVKIHPAGTEN